MQHAKQEKIKELRNQSKKTKDQSKAEKMKLKVQKRLAAQVFKISPKKVWFDDDRLEEIKEAITKADMRSLASKGIIRIKPSKEVSRGRARFRQIQRRKGKRKGHGSRKGR